MHNSMAAISFSSFVLQLVVPTCGHLRNAGTHLAETSKTHCNASMLVYVGLPRSGTTSFTEYAASLGFRSEHITLDASTADFEEMINQVKAGSCPGRRSNGDINRLMRLQSGPQDLVAFSDIPYFALSCEIAKCHPHSKFVSGEREFEGWFQSFQYMLCTSNSH